MPPVYTRASLIARLHEVRDMGFVPSVRPANSGGIGNTFETLLGVQENNLPTPDAGDFELKTQRLVTSSDITLFHMDPWPRQQYGGRGRRKSPVQGLLMPTYGWPHQEAGGLHPDSEMSFRHTIRGLDPTGRGFSVIVDEANDRLLTSWDASQVRPEFHSWRNRIEAAVGLGELDPQPYWDLDRLRAKASTKLKNAVFAQAEVRRVDGVEHFWFRQIRLLEDFTIDRFVACINEGKLVIDYDGRTGHNHGTKFRLVNESFWPDLYATVTVI